MQDTVEELQQTLGFLRPPGEGLPAGLDDLDEEQQVQYLKYYLSIWVGLIHM